MRKNSMLASLFRLPGDPMILHPRQPCRITNKSTGQWSYSTTSSSRRPDAQQQFQQNIQEAQSQMNELKNKLTQYGRGSSDEKCRKDLNPTIKKQKVFSKDLSWVQIFNHKKPTGFFRLPVISDYRWI